MRHVTLYTLDYRTKEEGWKTAIRREAMTPVQIWILRIAFRIIGCKTWITHETRTEWEPSRRSI